MNEQPDHTWVNIAELQVNAPDQATAQDALERAVAAAKAAIANITPAVTLLPEIEMGEYVLSNP